MKRSTVFLVTLGLFVALTCGAAADMVESEHARIDSNFWTEYDVSSNDYTSLEGFLTDIDIYVDLLTSELQVELKEKITVIFTNELGRKYSQRKDSRKMMYLQVTDLQQDTVELCHELTHQLAPSIYGVLFEGLAEYMSTKYERNPVVATRYLAPPHALAQLICLEVGDEELDQVLANTKWIEDMNAQKQKMYQRVGYSLVDYLVQEYGMEAFMKLYLLNNPKGYEAALGKSREEVIGAWKVFMAKQAEVELTRFGPTIYAEMEKILNM